MNNSDRGLRVMFFSLIVSTQVLSLVACAVLTEVNAAIPIEDLLKEISYPADWGPNLLDPAHDGRIVEVSSNGITEHGVDTLNDGKATRDYRWEPVWDEGDSYVIVELGRLATITRIRFDSPGRYDDGYPKAARVTAVNDEFEPIGVSMQFDLPNDERQVMEFPPNSLPRTRLIRFDFGSDAYNDSRGIVIGEIAIFGTSAISLIHDIAPGSETEGRVLSLDGNQIFGTLSFPEDVIKVKRPEGNLSISAESVYGVRVFLTSSEPLADQVLLWSGEIITGKLDPQDSIEIEFGDAVLGVQLDRIRDLAFPAKEDVFIGRDIENRGTMELTAGDRLLLEPGSVALSIEPESSSLVGKFVELHTVSRIEPAFPDKAFHRVIFQNREIAHVQFAAGPTVEIDVGDLAPISVRLNEIKHYRGLTPQSDMLPTGDFDILALRNGELVIGEVINPQIILSTNIFGQVSIDLKTVITMRSEDDRVGWVEVRLQNGSRLRGKLISKSINFRRHNQDDPINLIPNNIGLLHRLTMERRTAISQGVGYQDAKSPEISEVAIYVLGIIDEGESRTNALTSNAKERGLWVFERP